MLRPAGNAGQYKSKKSFLLKSHFFFKSGPEDACAYTLTPYYQLVAKDSAGRKSGFGEGRSGWIPSNKSLSLPVETILAYGRIPGENGH